MTWSYLIPIRQFPRVNNTHVTIVSDARGSGYQSNARSLRLSASYHRSKSRKWIETSHGLIVPRSTTLAPTEISDQTELKKRNGLSYLSTRRCKNVVEASGPSPFGTGSRVNWGGSTLEHPTGTTYLIRSKKCVTGVLSFYRCYILEGWYEDCTPSWWRGSRLYFSRDWRTTDASESLSFLSGNRVTATAKLVLVFEFELLIHIHKIKVVYVDRMTFSDWMTGKHRYTSLGEFLLRICERWCTECNGSVWQSKWLVLFVIFF